MMKPTEPSKETHSFSVDPLPIGQIISDADILIAATARYHGLPLVTENAAHFHRISGLVLKSWR